MDANKTLFYSVRHGRTKGNELDIYRGWSKEDYAQLAPEGRDDAREAGLYLKRAGLEFPILITDDLPRAKETASILAEVLGIKAIESDRRARPLDVGDYTGKSKKKYPLDEYIKNQSKKIPGGESMKGFKKRAAEFHSDVFELIRKLKKPILKVDHGSTISFLNEIANQGQSDYESLVKPGGVLVYTSQGFYPLLKMKVDEEDKQTWTDGTVISGFVTADENQPPRACFNCRWVAKGVGDVLGCWHPLVQVDPQLQNRKQDDGSIAVAAWDCCNSFQSVQNKPR
jgi:2,3-bisphosphoglycerate-dependent phosphoglycerate mutase